MRKFILALLFSSSFCFGQNKDKNEWQVKFDLLINYLSSEDWDKSEKLSKQLLDITDEDDTMEIQTKVLRYMYIYSTAGLLNEKKLSKEKALKNITFLKSKEMIMPSHLFNSNCYSNCTNLNDDTPDTFFTAVNNKNATQIFSFEYVKIKDGIKDGIKESKSELEGKYITLRGVLNEISVEGNILPRFKLKFIEGDYIIKDAK